MVSNLPSRSCFRGLSCSFQKDRPRDSPAWALQQRRRRTRPSDLPLENSRHLEEYQTCLLRNLYAAQEATVRTGHGTTDWIQIEKGVRQGCILSPCLFNLYAEYIMRNPGLEEAQAGVKIAGRNLNNLRYVDDTTLLWQTAKKN